MYPGIVATNNAMRFCETLDLGARQGTGEYLIADRSVDCTTAQYAKDRDMGLVFLFGIGIPLCSGLIVKLMQETTFNGDLAQARLLFHFLTGGFGQKWWFWEGFLTFRNLPLSSPLPLS
jgi:hypothetical protein